MTSPPCSLENFSANALYVPKASCKYFCPTSFRYSSIALVASVFSLKMRCSFSPQRSTSDIIRSVKKSWKAKPTVGHHALTLVPQSCSSPAPRGPTFVRHPGGAAGDLCDHLPEFPQRGGEIKLWRASTLAPQQCLIPHPHLPLRRCRFLAALVSASHSVGKPCSPLLNMAVFNCTGCKPGLRSDVLSCAQLMAETEASDMH